MSEPGASDVINQPMTVDQAKLQLAALAEDPNSRSAPMRVMRRRLPRSRG